MYTRNMEKQPQIEKKNMKQWRTKIDPSKNTLEVLNIIYITKYFSPYHYYAILNFIVEFLDV